MLPPPPLQPQPQPQPRQGHRRRLRLHSPGRLRQVRGPEKGGPRRATETLKVDLSRSHSPRHNGSSSRRRRLLRPSSGIYHPLNGGVQRPPPLPRPLQRPAAAAPAGPTRCAVSRRRTCAPAATRLIAAGEARRKFGQIVSGPLSLFFSLSFSLSLSLSVAPSLSSLSPFLSFSFSFSFSLSLLSSLSLFLSLSSLSHPFALSPSPLSPHLCFSPSSSSCPASIRRRSRVSHCRQTSPRGADSGPPVTPFPIGTCGQAVAEHDRTYGCIRPKRWFGAPRPR